MSDDGNLRVGACLSLTGRYGRFGSQAAKALRVWETLDGDVKVVVEDDRSDPAGVGDALRRAAGRCDLLLGPYSTQLMRVAGRVASDEGWLLWNHGGSGDDVEAATPGYVVSVLTPTTRYAEPFLRQIAADDRLTLWVVEGRGSFGRQVADGAMTVAQRLNLDAVRIGVDDMWSLDRPQRWGVISAGTFEDDVETMRRLLDMPMPPDMLCAVAAGVHEFADRVADPEGVYGIAQWFPGTTPDPQLGPSEAEFLAAYRRAASSTPDYPAVQAVAAAALATHCARRAEGTERRALWAVATELEATTLFGRFKVHPTTGVQLGHDTVLVRWFKGDALRLAAG